MSKTCLYRDIFLRPVSVLILLSHIPTLALAENEQDEQVVCSGKFLKKIHAEAEDSLKKAESASSTANNIKLVGGPPSNDYYEDSVDIAEQGLLATQAQRTIISDSKTNLLFNLGQVKRLKNPRLHPGCARVMNLTELEKRIIAKIDKVEKLDRDNNTTEQMTVAALKESRAYGDGNGDLAQNWEGLYPQTVSKAQQVYARGDGINTNHNRVANTQERLDEISGATTPHIDEREYLPDDKTQVRVLTSEGNPKDLLGPWRQKPGPKNPYDEGHDRRSETPLLSNENAIAESPVFLPDNNDDRNIATLLKKMDNPFGPGNSLLADTGVQEANADCKVRAGGLTNLSISDCGWRWLNGGLQHDQQQQIYTTIQRQVPKIVRTKDGSPYPGRRNPVNPLNKNN